MANLVAEEEGQVVLKLGEVVVVEGPVTLSKFYIKIEELAITSIKHRKENDINC